MSKKSGEKDSDAVEKNLDKYQSQSVINEYKEQAEKVSSEKDIIGLNLDSDRQREYDKCMLEEITVLASFTKGGFENLTFKEKSTWDDQKIAYDEKKSLSYRITKIKKELCTFALDRATAYLVETNNAVLNQTGSIFDFLNSSMRNLQEYELKQQRKYLNLVHKCKAKHIHMQGHVQEDESRLSGRAWREHVTELRE